MDWKGQSQILNCPRLVLVNAYGSVIGVKEDHVDDSSTEVC